MSRHGRKAVSMSCTVLVLLLAVMVTPMYGQSTDDLKSESSIRNAIRDLRTRVAALENSVAFSAVMSTVDVQGLKAGDTLKFDSVLYNTGNGYNPSTGVFTAPSAGTYVFYTRVMVNINSKELIQTAIYKGSTKLAGWADADCCNVSSGSTMGAVHLEKGERVHVQVHSGSKLWGDHTTFLGFKV